MRYLESNLRTSGTPSLSLFEPKEKHEEKDEEEEGEEEQEEEAEEKEEGRGGVENSSN